jgi:hypothetical protein
MSDPDPASYSLPSKTGGALYRDVVDVAFDVLRGDLMRERKKLKQRRNERNVPRLQPAVPVSNSVEGIKKLPDRLARLKELYRARYGAGVGRQYVPSQRKTWTHADKQKVLYHLAKIIYDRDLAETVYAGEQRLRELWEDGYFQAVERLCNDAEDAPASPRSEELQWLLATWIPRQASKAASLLTSQRLAPSRRLRRPASSEPVKPSSRRSRSTTRRAPSVRPGG